MSTVAPTRSSPMPVDPGWVPSSLYRLTLEQYEGMIDAGLFTGRERVHLINGFLVARMTESPPQSTADLLCGAELGRVIPPGWHVRAQAHPDPQPGSR